MNDHPAMTLVGTRYAVGGQTPRDGFDCFTLARYVRRHCYGRETPTGGVPVEAMKRAQASAFAIYRATGGRERIAPPWIELAHDAEGCMVGLGRWRLRRLHHCGVVVGSGVLHAMTGCGVVWTPLARLRDIFARVEFFEC
jgi:hypothetical protein